MNHLERGEEGGRKGKEKGEIEKIEGKKGRSEEQWGSMKGKVWEVDSLQDVTRITNQ